MKKLILFASLAVMCVAAVSAQIKNQEMEQYRRSSLCMVMLEDPNLNADAAAHVKAAFLENPLPSKYNDHGVDKSVCAFSFNDVTVTEEDKAAYNAMIGKKPASAAAAVAKEALAEILKLDPLKDEAPYVAWKYLKEQNFAQKAMQRWWGVDKGSFNVDLLRERVAWNANELEKANAAEQTAGRSIEDYLMDNGGDEIISNTFVPVVRFRYMSADEVAAEIIAYAEIAAKAAEMLPGPAALAATGIRTGATAAAAVVKGIGGYFVYTTTYLYRLKWNQDIYNKIGETGGDIAKFNAMDCFELEFVGDEKASASVAQKKYSDDEAIKRATARALDKVFAKLEKKYEVFRTKTPLATVSPKMTAYIGSKECVEKGDKYEILVREIDPATNKEKYKSVGKIAVEIVGNNMGDDNDDEKAAAEPFTTFKGKAPKNAVPGMLIRQR